MRILKGICGNNVRNCILPAKHRGKCVFAPIRVKGTDGNGGLNRRELLCQYTAQYLNWKVIRYGWPDFLLYRQGITAVMEVKSEITTLSKVQLEVKEILQQAGIEYYVVRNTIDVQKWLQ